jgi:hypothetical protein
MFCPRREIYLENSLIRTYTNTINSENYSGKACMKKINRITLIFATLPLVIIALLLFLRWNEYGQSYKSLANWGKGIFRNSEKAYYTNKVINIIAKWQKTDNNPDSSVSDSNSVFLHFDLEQNAIWLEENGQVKTEDYCEFPFNSGNGALYYPPFPKATELPRRTILQIKDPNQKLQSLFLLKCGSFNFFFDTRTIAGSPVFPAGSVYMSGSSQKTDDYTSLIVSEEEYEKYKNSVSQKKSGQPNEKATTQQTVLEEKKSRWLEGEKLLYMEIEGQVLNAGYELDSLELEAGFDYNAAYAVIQGHGENVVYKYLDLGGGSKTVRAYLKIDYLGNDIWYAKTWPHPKRTLKSDRKLDLEFLIFPDEQIPHSQYRKYIEQGRKLQQSESFPTAKWKAALPDGVVIEIIGIRYSNNPDKWWGPDGSALEFPDYFKIEPIKADENTSQIVWQIKFPENRVGRRTFFVPEGAKDTRTVAAHDRYGNAESVMISVYDSSLEKISFRIGAQASGQTSQYVNFENVSLVPGRNQGFNIETGER